jgi:AhpD family alkylhydroperoxidase
MKPRLNPFVTHADLMKPLIDLGQAVHGGLEPGLMLLVRIRASQINGCTISLYNNIRLARENGESEERIAMLPAWRQSPLYSERERAALGWTEALTQLSPTAASDAVYDELRKQFSEEEQVKLTLMIAIVNAFNRMGVGFRIGHPAAGVGKKAA